MAGNAVRCVGRETLVVGPARIHGRTRRSRLEASCSNLGPPWWRIACRESHSQNATSPASRSLRLSLPHVSVRDQWTIRPRMGPPHPARHRRRRCAFQSRPALRALSSRKNQDRCVSHCQVAAGSAEAPRHSPTKPLSWITRITLEEETRWIGGAAVRPNCPPE